MLNLSATTEKISLVTSAATTVDVQASHVDNTTATDKATPGSQQTKPTTATTTDIVAAPAAGDIRNVKFISIRNTDAATSNTVTAQKDVSGTLYTLMRVILLAGEELVCRDGVWFHYDANGGVYTIGQTFAVQADMETGTSTSLIVSPGVQHFHPGHPKAWVSCGVAADIQQSYNITSLTDTGTGVVTITIANDFSAATFCIVAQVEATATTWAVANSRECHVRSATRAAGSVALDCIDNTVTTNLVKDPTTWHCIMMGDL